jgi:hypothetical protein
MVVLALILLIIVLLVGFLTETDTNGNWFKYLDKLNKRYNSSKK